MLDMLVGSLCDGAGTTILGIGLGFGVLGGGIRTSADRACPAGGRGSAGGFATSVGAGLPCRP